MKSSLLMTGIAIAGFLAMSVFTFADQKLSEHEENFVKKCTAECGKLKRADCGDIRGQLVKFVTATSLMGENNPLAFEDMNSAGNRLADMCPQAMANRSF
ncbi:MAG: hypothetical protein KA369_24060 [Spirochaetes bacterium]|nr:hypothetical protein [Spirochaetota bacterium]